MGPGGGKSDLPGACIGEYSWGAVWVVLQGRGKHPILGVRPARGCAGDLGVPKDGC